MTSRKLLRKCKSVQSYAKPLLRITNQLLYQLSYTGVYLANRFDLFTFASHLGVISLAGIMRGFSTMAKRFGNRADA